MITQITINLRTVTANMFKVVTCSVVLLVKYFKTETETFQLIDYFQPQTDGYIAIVLPKLKEFDDVMKSLISKEDFNNSEAAAT